MFDAEDMQRFLADHAGRGEHEILRQYREHIDGILSERREQLLRWDRSHAFVQYEFMRGLRAALLARCEEWATGLGEEIPILRGANRSGDPWTQYWFCDALGWRIDGSQPLRLRVFTPDAGKRFAGWNADTWNMWTETFQRLLGACSLTEAQVTRRMYRAGALVNEGTVGAINVDSPPADRSIPQIVDLHVAFLAEVGLKAE